MQLKGKNILNILDLDILINDWYLLKMRNDSDRYFIFHWKFLSQGWRHYKLHAQIWYAWMEQTFFYASFSIYR